mgnify:CR=1 FL=1
MILAAHTPDFFPALAVFQKMLSADVFVFGDDVQFSTHAQTNRARINTSEGPKWLTVPVLTKGLGPQPVKDIRIANHIDWRKNHWRTLAVNYQQSAYFEKFDLYLEQIYRKEWRFLIDLNFELLEFARRELEIDIQNRLSSEISPGGSGTPKILQIARKLKCKTYLCEADSLRFLDSAMFLRENMRLQSSEFRVPQYHQQFGGFQPGLSILDLLLNEGEVSRKLLEHGIIVADRHSKITEESR